jgi:hypothetical protein
MNSLKTTVIFLLCLFFLSCGIDEYYYLPLLSEGRIKALMNTEAEINIPSNLLGQSYYATGYTIFYKIYISDLKINNVNDINSYRDSNIYRDYSNLFPYTDPSNATSITSLTTFSSRGFHELELEGTDIKNTVLSKSGGTFNIQFPTRPGDKPYIEYNEEQYSLLRSNGSKEGSPFNPKPDNDRYFRNSDDLRNYSYATSAINADVAGQSAVNEQTNAYASMYIVAVGQNPRNFTRLYSKPTHINIFILTPFN